jgi:hypothetical protein
MRLEKLLVKELDASVIHLDGTQIASIFGILRVVLQTCTVGLFCRTFLTMQL